MELGRRWRWAALPTLLAMSAAQKSCPAGEKTLSMRLATAGVSARECLFDLPFNFIRFRVGAWVHDGSMRTSNRRHLECHVAMRAVLEDAAQRTTANHRLFCKHSLMGTCESHLQHRCHCVTQ
jgi:hypothetical protein